MEDENAAPVVTQCPLCDRIVVPGQLHCPCGWRVTAKPVLPVGTFPAALLMPVVPILGTLWLLLIIFNPQWLTFSAMSLVKALGVTLIASAALAVVIADRAERENWALQPAPLNNLTPITWFVATLVLWPVSYPLFAFIHYWGSRRFRAIITIIASLCVITCTIWILTVSMNQLPELGNRPGPVTKGTPAPAFQPTPAPNPAMIIPPPASSPSASQPVGTPAAVSTAAPSIAPAPVSNPPTQPVHVTPTPWVPPQAPPPPEARSKPAQKNQDSPEMGVDILKAR